MKTYLSVTLLICIQEMNLIG